MTCIQCGKRIKKSQPICPYCGAAQNKAEGESVQISLSQLSKTGKKKPLTRKQLIQRIAIIGGAVLLALAVVVTSVLLAVLGQVNRESELSGSMGVNTELNTKGVQNIALFGLDSRRNNDVGRSDAMIILSIDRNHNAIKMTSIARDSLVAIDGHGYDKITHAWSYGKANLAVKTINQNFGMNITDYVYVNFYEFVGLIDYIGGVYIDVDASEKYVMNTNYAPELNSLGLECPKVTQTGMQLLTGAQALAYSRNRYTGSDIDRGNRQKEVLQAAFDQVKTLSMAKYPALISKVLSMCHTNLTNSDLLSIAYWTMTAQPAFATFNLPNPNCKPQGGNWNDGLGWVYRYDLDLATQELHKFIYETEVTELPSRPATRPLPSSTTTTTAAEDITTTESDVTTTGDSITTTTNPNATTTTTKNGVTTTTDPKVTTTTTGPKVTTTTTTTNPNATTTTVATP